MMNKLVALAIFSVSVLNATAQHTETLAQEQIKMVMKFQEMNWNHGDIPAYMKGYWNSDSLLFVGGRGPTYGYQKTLTNYLKSYPNKEKMGQLHFDLIKIEILSDEDAFVVGAWTLQRSADTLGGHFSLLWKKIDEEWKIIADHSSSNQ